MPNRHDVPSLNMGTFLFALHRQFPKFVFTSGLSSKGRYCVFVHTAPKNGDTLPDMNSEIAQFETEGSSEEAIEVLCTKIALVHG